MADHGLPWEAGGYRLAFLRYVQEHNMEFKSQNDRRPPGTTI